MSAKARKYLWAALSLALYLVLIHLIEREASTHIQIGFATLFVLYFWGIQQPKPPSVRELIGIGVLLRLATATHLPTLSDDFYRFLWDGFLMHKGFHPLAHTPLYYMESNPVRFAPYAQLYQAMNSPTYYTIYPTLLQAIFYLSTFGSPEKLFLAVSVMRLPILLADLWVCHLLLRTNLDTTQRSTQVAALYFWNPLIILEGVGNLHAEPILLACLLWALAQKNNIRIACGLTTAIATKVTPLILMPYIARRIRLKKSFWIPFGIGILLWTLPLKLWTYYGIGMMTSFELYFDSFCFNAAPYRFIFHIAHFFSPVQAPVWASLSLACVAIGVILYISWRTNLRTAPHTIALYIYAVFLFCSSTVHPWYLIPLLGMAAASGTKWPWLWAWMAMISYIAYDPTITHQQRVTWELAEYLLIFMLFYAEWRTSTKKLFTK